MTRKFVSDVANFAIGLGHLRNSCPPSSGPISREETRQILAEINNAKGFLQSRGAQGSLDGLKKCGTLSLMRKESIPLTPAGFFNWLTVAEQQLEAPPPPIENNSPTSYPPSSLVPTSYPPSVLAPKADPPFWELPWLNVGEYQITTKDILIGSIISVLLSREGFRIYQRR